jgi:hypothetical protein
MRRSRSIFVFIILTCLSATNAQVAPPAQKGALHQGAHAGAMQKGPMQGGMAATGDMKKEKAKLEALSKASAAARLNMKKMSTTKGAVPAKKKCADTIYKEAEVVLVTPALGPKEKYPKALRLYREVVKLDPTNSKAKTTIKTIEDIYKSMGRPIPH